MKSTIDISYNIAPDRDEMGRRAALQCAGLIRHLLGEQEMVRVIFAAAPSQSQFLMYLNREQNIDWKRVTAFHMDEYHELDPGHPELFSTFLKKHIWDHLPFGRIEPIRSGLTGNAEALSECSRYAALLDKAPVDICFLGIGENGHLAFNDPAVADFNDTEKVKIVELDETCRMQQLHDAGFNAIEDVPKTAITLTIPELMKCSYLSVVVPGKRKAEAVGRALNGEISTSCPASILRKHENAIIWLDSASARLLQPGGKAGKTV